MFGQDWDKAEATVVARDAKFTGDGSVATYTYVADVRLASGETFRATVKEPTIATNFWAPDIGMTVSVLVRTKDRKVKFDKDDDQMSVKAHDAAKKAAFQAAQQQPAGTAPAGPTMPVGIPDAVAAKLAQLGIDPSTPLQVFTAGPAAAEPSVTDRLSRLQGLRDAGVLTPEEYAEQRQRILDEL
ncbi:MAG: SHOCT domain-containing protein [Marmoricola sp.]